MTTTQEPRDWHARGGTEVGAALEVDLAVGLTVVEAARRLEEVGPNALDAAVPRTLLSIFLRQFQSPLIYLLFGAAALALALSEVKDAIVIAVVVLLNAVIGAAQESRAERSLDALRRLAATHTRVLRGGAESDLDARELVPGDVVLLAAGDAVPADARLIDAASLQVAEAALTGESVPVEKAIDPVDAAAVLADRRSMVYAGTHVTAGRGRGIVVATGARTEVGGIAALAAGAERPKTPLERRIAAFGQQLLVIAGVLFAVVIVVGLLRAVPLRDIVMIAVSQVVGLVPEGLPVAMTIALAVGVQRMARRRVIVRELAAVETLGSTTVIASDKTGTLTKNEMTVTAVALASGAEIAVSGVGYAPEGEFSATSPDLLRLLEAGALCNDASLAPPSAEEPRWLALGDPTEAALVVAAAKAGLDVAHLRAEHPRRGELPFDADTKLMATVHDDAVAPRLVLKGAPEEVLALCGSVRENDQVVAMDEARRAAVVAAAAALLGRALRVLGFAEVPGGGVGGGFPGLRGKGVFLGFVGQLDPPREGVLEAVRACRAAGIHPVVITGDHRETGLTIARALGIAEAGDEAIDGSELDALRDPDLDQRIGRIAVFARVHPAQKLRIVEAFQRAGEVVAMTGDGVNDAPALVQADVGVAMGRSGTEVAKEAAKIVIVDDDFATIVAAVEEGRVVSRNLKKIVILFVSTGAAEILVLLLAMLLGYPPPFAAVMILWNNLVTEGLITVNLALDPAQGDEMTLPPIPRDEPLITRPMIARIGLMTSAIVLSTLGWFLYRMQSGAPAVVASTEAFTVLAACEWYNVLNCRSEIQSALSLKILRNHWLVGGLIAGNLLQVAVVFWAPLNRLFYTTPIDLHYVVAIAFIASPVLWVEEARKWWVRRRSGRAESKIKTKTKTKN